MSGDSVALDTTQAVHILNDVPEVVRRFSEADRLCLSVIVIGELRYGALNSARAKQNLERVERLIARCYVLSIDDEIAEAYARIRLSLKQQGTPIPENDIWIAATCVRHDIALATDDGHFDHVSHLKLLGRT